MPAALTNIAEAVKDELEAATLSKTFACERAYMPIYDAKVAGLKVYVLTLGQQVENTTRFADQFTYQVKVAIYQKAKPDDVATLDGLVAFAEEVIDLLRSKKQLTNYAEASLAGIGNEPVYDPAQLNENHVFQTVITLDYRLLR